MLDLMNNNKRMLTENFLEISYEAQENGCTTIIPELIDWFITEFENDYMKIFLNLTNPVYVSSSDVADQVNIRVVEPMFF